MKSPRAERRFALLLRLFPGGFRHRFEDEMRSVLGSDHASSRDRGPRALAAFWWRTVIGVLRTAPAEHLEAAALDARYALRRLLRRPLFSVTACLSLAVGIGATTAVVAVYKAALLDGIPGIVAPRRLVNVKPIAARAETFELVPYPYYAALRAGEAVLSDLAGFHGTTTSLGSGAPGEAEVRGTQVVSTNYFRTLGVRPRLGRFFLEEEEAEAIPVAVVSDRLWRDRLGAAPMGSQVRINGRTFTVVGVAPPGFRGHFKGFGFDVFIPMGMAEVAGLPDHRDRSHGWVEMVGRLAPGVGMEAAGAALGSLGHALADAFPRERGNLELTVERNRGIDAELRSGLLVLLVTLFFIGAFVLAIACLNVAAVMLGDLMGRRGEMALRRSLGAPPNRLASQLLVESGLVALVGGGLGFLLATWATRLASAALGSVDSRVSLAVRLDAGVLGAVLALCAATTIVAGLAPALAAARAEPVEALRTHRRPGKGHTRFFKALVIGQVVLSFVVLVTASLFLRALERAVTLDPGFETAGVELTTLEPELAGMRADDIRNFFAEARERIAALPGVEAVALTSRVPLSLGARLFPNPLEIQIAGWEPPPGQEGFLIEHAIVSSGYFDTLRIPIVAGRGFGRSDREGAAPVVIVDVAFADRFFPGGAVGRSVSRGATAITIVGVAAQSRYRAIDEAPAPFLYLPFDQHPRNAAVLLARARDAGAVPADMPGTGGPTGMAGEGRVGGAGAPGRGDTAPEARSALAAEIRRSLHELAPKLPVPDVESLDSRLAATFLPQRVAALTSAILGAVGLALSGIGLYGVLGIWVGRRRHEIGLRIALGARPADVQRLVLRQGVAAALAGVAVGIPLAVAGSRLFGSFLVGMSSNDPWSYLAVSALLLASALLASLLPAYRAARCDPMALLKES
ncbi:MAG TPA: ABC transporter permease [Thermoanaerobaculia bacterium]|nr:ABC transporter permease [Thermoanaerobaculia bacterium]